jgi:OmpA-OmpF porin, OOP family
LILYVVHGFKTETKHYYKRIILTDMKSTFLNPSKCLPLLLLLVTLQVHAQVDQRIAKADQYYASGDYYTAAQLYEQFLNPVKKEIPKAEFPLNAKQNRQAGGMGKGVTKTDLLYKQAESYRLANYMQQAAAKYKAAAEKDPSKYLHAWYWRAVCFRSLSQLDSAETTINSFLANVTANDPYKVKAEEELATIRFIKSQWMRPDTVMFQVKQITLGNGSNKGSFAAAPSGNNQYIITSTETDTVITEGVNPNRNRMFHATFSNGVFNNVEVLSAEGANALMQQGTAAMSADGNNLYFTQWNNQKNSAIYRAVKTANGWGSVQLLSINKEGSNSKHPSVSGDGKTLLFASDRSGGAGKFDIWYAPLNGDGTVGEPVNAGAAINTEADEQSPFYHNTSNTLVFASNGRKGMGGYDLYMSKGAVGNWAIVENAGHPVNSTRDDLYFTAVEGAPLLSNAIFSSDRGSDCCLQNYTLVKAPKQQQLTGMVKDLTDQTPLSGAEVTLKDATGKTWKQITNEEGRYTFELTGKGPYSLAITKQYYKEKNTASQVETTDDKDWAVDVQKNKDEFIERRVILRPETVVTVYFDFDKYNLKAEAVAKLDSIFAVLTVTPGAALQISGYTDGKGTAEYNAVLSDRRARACAQYLIGKGIDSNRITFESFGACCPIEMELINGLDNEAGRAKNRRALINVVMPKEEE